MKSKTLAIIMAAGKGTRMGELTEDIPKAMLIDENTNKHLIDSALSLREYESESLDFSVLTRNEEPFPKLNDYLISEIGFDEEQLIYQTVKAQSCLLAFLMQYGKSLIPFKDKKSRNVFKKYDNFVLLPGDNHLTLEHLDLKDLVDNHIKSNADLTALYLSREGDSTAKNDLLKLEGKRVCYVERRMGKYDKGLMVAEATGVYVIKKSLFRKYLCLHICNSLIGKRLNKDREFDFDALGLHAQAYFMDNWGGGRDTPESLRTK